MLYFIFNIHVRINPFKETQLETIDSKASKRPVIIKWLIKALLFHNRK